MGVGSPALRCFRAVFLVGVPAHGQLVGSSVQFLATRKEELATDHNILAWFFLITDCSK